MSCGLVLDRDVNAALNLAALAAADTGELRREQPDRTDARPAQRAAVAIGPLRDESIKTQRHLRKEATVDHQANSC
jgi:putative transposase